MKERKTRTRSKSKTEFPQRHHCMHNHNHIALCIRMWVCSVLFDCPCLAICLVFVCGVRSERKRDSITICISTQRFTLDLLLFYMIFFFFLSSFIQFFFRLILLFFFHFSSCTFVPSPSYTDLSHSFSLACSFNVCHTAHTECKRNVWAVNILTPGHFNKITSKNYKSHSFLFLLILFRGLWSLSLFFVGCSYLNCIQLFDSFSWMLCL